MKTTPEQPSFNELIERLKVCSEIKYPNRLWSEEAKVNIAFEWVGKYDDLLKRVELLEEDLTKED